MASKRRIRDKERKKKCGKKKAFDSELEANNAMYGFKNKVAKQDWFVSYHCKFCGKWHYGHPPYNVRQSLKDKAKNKKKMRVWKKLLLKKS
jgi:hypothetical protein